MKGIYVRCVRCGTPAITSAVLVVLLAYAAAFAWIGSAGAQSTGLAGIDDADALVRAGIAKANEGRPDEAVDLFSRSLQLRPRNAAAFYNRGKVYLIQKRFDLAIQDLDRALKLDPKLSEIGRAHV